MYKTIEALYKEGVIIPLMEEIPVKYARILITIWNPEKIFQEFRVMN